MLGLCVASPLTLQALEIGHPEELLGACMCIAAVLLANRNRMVPAALMLGLAIANKEWALLAIGPVLLALSSTLLVWLTFQWAPTHISADAQAALFLAWSLPLMGLLGVALYGPPRALVERYELLRQAREPLTAGLANQH